MADSQAAAAAKAPTPPLSIIAQFRVFLLQTNALALAIGVVIGGAVSKLVAALVSGLIMPLIGLALPGGEWRQIKVPLDAAGNALAIGDVLGASVDFVIVAWVVFLLTTKLLKPAPAPAK
jgi:large conductance mechanosensitive channel